MSYQPYDPIQYSGPPAQYPPTAPYPDPNGYYAGDPASGVPYSAGQYSGVPYSGVPYPPPGQLAVPNPYTPPVLTIGLTPSSGSATASLVFGIIGIVGGWCLLGIPCLLAVILGHIGLIQTRDGRATGRGMAVGGLVLGYVCVIPMVIITLWLFSTWIQVASDGQ